MYAYERPRAVTLLVTEGRMMVARAWWERGHRELFSGCQVSVRMKRFWRLAEQQRKYT